MDALGSFDFTEFLGEFDQSLQFNEYQAKIWIFKLRSKSTIPAAHRLVTPCNHV